MELHAAGFFIALQTAAGIPSLEKADIPFPGAQYLRLVVDKRNNCRWTGNDGAAVNDQVHLVTEDIVHIKAVNRRRLVPVQQGAGVEDRITHHFD